MVTKNKFHIVRYVVDNNDNKFYIGDTVKVVTISGKEFTDIIEHVGRNGNTVTFKYHSLHCDRIESMIKTK